MNRWFRWYEGTTEDAKFRVVARMSRVTVRDVIALWAFILEDAAHLEHRGVCLRSEMFMSAALDFKDGVVNRILSAMQEATIIVRGETSLTVCNFNKRQFDSDIDSNAARRKREQRERDRLNGHASVTRDTGGSDTESYTDKKDSRSVRRDFEQEFDAWYSAYPKHQARGQALKAYRAARKKVAADALLSAAQIARKRYAGTEPKFIPLPASWLNGERWSDEAGSNTGNDFYDNPTAGILL